MSRGGAKRKMPASRRAEKDVKVTTCDACGEPPLLTSRLASGRYGTVIALCEEHSDQIGVRTRSFLLLAGQVKPRDKRESKFVVDTLARANS